MFQVIAALIGVAGGANDKANAQYMLDKQQQANTVEYSRAKNMIALNDASKQGLMMLIILIALIAVIFFAFKNR